MDIRRLLYVESIYLVLILFVLQTLTASEIFDEDDDDSGSWNRCPWIRNKLKNGRVKIRSRGRIAKFLCEPGYELAGKRFATCVRGQWNNPIPVCVSRGCYRPPHVDNGRVTLMYRGAVLMYDCLPGYTLDGSSSIYCDGRRWSSDTPSCLVSTADPQTSCDFEDPDLCGWSHDPTHDFDWKRNQLATPSGHAGTGPSYDHTFGEGKGGFYLFMEASAPRAINDTARLFSPVYPSEYSDGCFIFWYHMFGSTTGGLRVYVKPESQIFGEMPAAWVLFGDQGNRWHRGNVTVPQFAERFQIIIEGIRGTSYLGDTAIDDVSLYTIDCESVGNSTDNTSETGSDSCRGRCRETTNTSSCGCNEDCIWSNSCCDDFTSICTKNADSDNDENKDEHSINRSTTTTVTITDVTVHEELIKTDTLTSNSNRDSNTLPTTIGVPLTTVATLSSHETTYFTVPSEVKEITVIPTSLTSIKAATTSTTSLTTSTIPSTTSTTPSTSFTTPSTTKTTPSTTNTPPSITETTPSTTKTTLSPTSTILPTTSSILPTTSPILPTTSSTPTATTSTTQQTTISSKPLSTTTLIPSSTSMKPFVTIPVVVLTSSSASFFSSPSPMITQTQSESNAPTTFSASSTELQTAMSETQSTRKTYNLRPRLRTSPMTTSTTRATTTSSSTSPPSTTRKITSIYRPNVQTTEFRRGLSWTSTSAVEKFTAPTQSSRVTSMSQKTTRKFPSSDERTKTTEETVSRIEPPALKTSSAVSDSSQPVITIVSVTIVILICVIAGVVFYVRRWKTKKLSKLEDDSEMRFLSENEVVEYSDSSALDRINFNP